MQHDTTWSMRDVGDQPSPEMVDWAQGEDAAARYPDCSRRARPATGGRSGAAGRPCRERVGRRTAGDVRAAAGGALIP